MVNVALGVGGARVVRAPIRSRGCGHGVHDGYLRIALRAEEHPPAMMRQLPVGVYQIYLL